MADLTKAQRLERAGRIDHRCRLAARTVDHAIEAAHDLGDGAVVQQLTELRDALYEEAQRARDARSHEVHRR